MIWPRSGKNTNGIFSDDEPLTNGEREHSAITTTTTKTKTTTKLPSVRKSCIMMVNKISNVYIPAVITSTTTLSRTQIETLINFNEYFSSFFCIPTKQFQILSFVMFFFPKNPLTFSPIVIVSLLAKVALKYFPFIKKCWQLEMICSIIANCCHNSKRLQLPFVVIFICL